MPLLLFISTGFYWSFLSLWPHLFISQFLKRELPKSYARCFRFLVQALGKTTDFFKWFKFFLSQYPRQLFQNTNFKNSFKTLNQSQSNIIWIICDRQFDFDDGEYHCASCDVYRDWLLNHSWWSHDGCDFLHRQSDSCLFLITREVLPTILSPSKGLSS